MYKIVAVLANPQNELELYRAANALSKAAGSKGIDLKIEIQEYPLTHRHLTEAEISLCDVAILTGDTPLTGVERFSGIPVWRTLTNRIFADPAAVLSAAIKHVDVQSRSLTAV